MASDKVAQILKVRSNFSSEQIETMSDAEAWSWIYGQDKRHKLERVGRPEICFTGFSVSERAEMEANAITHGFEVKDSVTKTLRYLCVGQNAGPAKIAKAEKQKVQILSATDFIRLCGTGEVDDHGA